MAEDLALIEDGPWNPRVALKAAVAAAMDEYVEGDPVPPGHCVAVRCRDKSEAKFMVKAMQNMAFAADRLKHDGTWYAYITDLRGTDPDDAVFELGWHQTDVGWIPDPSIIPA